MNKKNFAMLVLIVLAIFTPLFAQETEASTEETASEKTFLFDVKPLAAAFAVGLACLAGGIAVGKIGAAAMGAMSEDASLSGKALPFVGLAEGICLWGFLIAFLLIN